MPSGCPAGANGKQASYLLEGSRTTRCCCLYNPPRQKWEGLDGLEVPSPLGSGAPAGPGYTARVTCETSDRSTLDMPQKSDEKKKKRRRNKAKSKRSGKRSGGRARTYGSHHLASPPTEKETCMRAAYYLQANGATETFDGGLVRKKRGWGMGDDGAAERSRVFQICTAKVCFSLSVLVSCGFCADHPCRSAGAEVGISDL